MGDKKKILAIIATIILVGGLAAGWIIWRRDVTANKQDEQTQQAEQPKEQSQNSTDNTSGNTNDKQKTAVTGETDEKAQQLAIRFEHAARDWGTDANLDPKQFNKQDGQQVLAQLRGNIPDQSPIDQFGIKPNEGAGPYATSYICQQDPGGAVCSQQPKMRDWLWNQAWAYGSRWTAEPKVKTQDGRIRITGKVKAVLLQDDDTYKGSGYSALTPAWKTYEVDDLITVVDGKISTVEHKKSDPWFIDPYLRTWDNEIGDVFNDSSDVARVVIPVSGDVSMNLHHDMLSTVLAAPKTMGDMDNADWSMWDDINMLPTEEQNEKLYQDCMAQYGEKCPLHMPGK